MKKQIRSFILYSFLIACCLASDTLKAPACIEHLSHSHIQHMHHRSSPQARHHCKKHQKHMISQKHTKHLPTPYMQDMMVTSVQPEPSTKTKTDKQKKQRSICLKNGITKKMISYTKCFVSYTPDFRLQIGDQELRPGKAQTITVDGDTITIAYDYNFLNGYKKGRRVVSFALPEHKNEFEVTFSWKNDWRVILESAKPISANLVY